MALEEFAKYAQLLQNRDRLGREKLAAHLMPRKAASLHELYGSAFFESSESGRCSGRACTQDADDFAHSPRRPFSAWTFPGYCSSAIFQARAAIALSPCFCAAFAHASATGRG